MKLTVTINTDASFGPQSKVGAYAMWIVSQRGRITKAGYFKEDDMLTAEHCEIAAIANAVHTLKKAQWGELGKVIINTDCQHAIKRIQGKFNRDGYPMAKWVAKAIEDMDVEFRYVAAQTYGAVARTWVNNWCDEQAKIWRRKREKELTTKNTIK